MPDSHTRNETSLVFSAAQILLRSLLWIPIGLALLVLFPPDPGLTAEALRAAYTTDAQAGTEAAVILDRVG